MKLMEAVFQKTNFGKSILGDKFVEIQRINTLSVLPVGIGSLSLRWTLSYLPTLHFSLKPINKKTHTAPTISVLTNTS